MDKMALEYIGYFVIFVALALYIGSYIGISYHFLFTYPTVPMSDVELNLSANQFAVGMFLHELRWLAFGFGAAVIYYRMKKIRGLYHGKG